MQLLRKHARQGRNFVVICGNTKVGAPGGCRDALDYVLDDLEDNNLQGAAFVYTPSKSLYLAGPSFRYRTMSKATNTVLPGMLLR